jgi:hypothetical protein
MGTLHHSHEGDCKYAVFHATVLRSGISLLRGTRQLAAQAIGLRLLPNRATGSLLVFGTKQPS